MTGPTHRAGGPGRVPDPYDTGPIEIRALLTALRLVPGPVRLLAGRPWAPPPEVRWIAVDATSVELISDDALTLAHTAASYEPHHTAVPAATWVITILRTFTLDAAPHAFADTDVITLGRHTAHHHQHPHLGDTWWIPQPSLVVHRSPRSRWIGIRYTNPVTARDWTPRIVARLLTTPLHPTPSDPTPSDPVPPDAGSRRGSRPRRGRRPPPGGGGP